MDNSYMQDFDIERFVAMIKDHSFIYDPRDPKHCNRYIISASWKNIAMEMNSTEKMCRNKWTTLRSNYVRELRKYNDPTSPPKTKWPYFDILNFLQPYIKSRLPSDNTMSGTDDENSMGESSLKQENNEQKNWVDSVQVAEKLEIVSRPRKRYPSQNGLESQYTSESKKIRKEAPAIYDDDDDKHFLLSILPQMRQLAPRDNLIFRMEVQQLLINKIFP